MWRRLSDTGHSGALTPGMRFAVLSQIVFLPLLSIPHSYLPEFLVAAADHERTRQYRQAVGMPLLVCCQRQQHINAPLQAAQTARERHWVLAVMLSTDARDREDRLDACSDRPCLVKSTVFAKAVSVLQEPCFCKNP